MTDGTTAFGPYGYLVVAFSCVAFIIVTIRNSRKIADLERNADETNRLAREMLLLTESMQRTVVRMLSADDPEHPESLANKESAAENHRRTATDNQALRGNNE